MDGWSLLPWLFRNIFDPYSDTFIVYIGGAALTSCEPNLELTAKGSVESKGVGS